MKKLKSLKSKIVLKGNYKNGYVLIVQDKESYQDIAITYSELLSLLILLKKKFKDEE